MTAPGSVGGRFHILRLEGVGKRFGRRAVLADVNLRLSEGDFVLVAGPNGAGKTTLLRLLATTLRPSAGRLVWETAGDRVSAEDIRRAIGYAAHQPLVYDELSALENLRFVADVHGIEDSGAASARWLEAFGLADRSHERAATFSRGLRQRLALARAFVARPRLLLLDEPATALDSDAMRMFKDALKKLDGKPAVVVASHDPAPFAALATRRIDVHNRGLHEAAVTT